MKKHSQPFLRGFSLILCGLLATLSVAAQSAGGTLQGTVTYATNGNPLHNVVVTITQLRRTAETDEQGKYTFDNLPAGSYSVLAHLEGFPDVAQKVTVNAGSTAALDFTLQLTGVREQVTVTASGSEQATFDAVESVSTIASTQILEQASANLGDVLEKQTGVAKRSFGPGSTRPVVRGFDGDRVLVLQDGVRSGSVGSQSGDHGEPLDPLSVERIEVVRGPATLLYGSNALGGVVNAVSDRDQTRHEGTRGYFSTFAGTTNNQAGISGSLEYGRGGWLVWGNGTGQRAGDYDTPLGRVDNSRFRNGNGAGGVGYYGDKAFINAGYDYDNRRYGIPFAGVIEGDPDAEIDIAMRRHNVRFTGGFQNAESFLAGGNFALNYTNYNHKELEGDEVGTTFDNRTTSYRAVFNQRRSGRLSGTFGVEGYHRDYSSLGEEALIPGSVTAKMFSAFILQEYGTDRAKLQFGGRIENNRYDPSDATRPNRNFTGFSGAVGARLGLWTGGALVVNYTHTDRAPALEELYNNGPHVGNLTFEIGDPTLKREKGNGLEFSLRHSVNRVRLEGNFYYYRLSNFIFLAPTGAVEDGLPEANYVQGNARYLGAEVNAEFEAHRNLWLNMGLDYVNAELRDGRPLPRIPPLRLRLGLDYRRGGLSVRPELVLADAQDRVFPSPATSGVTDFDFRERRTAGYGIVNLAGSYTIARPHYAHIFAVNAFNLNNKLYRNHLSFIKEFAPEIGRGVRVSYTVRFF